MCVFRSQDHTHQNLKGFCASDRYTRLGFSFQMCEKMSRAVFKTKLTRFSAEQVQISNAEAKIAKKTD
ncbi:uncharacterized protein VP01_5547g2 [Puccinia sorghi]|uniref:Uncharacterized protein n=1 Tax=Puccinia sorghi TaxID=27349 RepID=A0A0L6UJY3_9BASI|nr:uncharacterized protein VP01_5547g2 [Puccinia sorghi]